MDHLRAPQLTLEFIRGQLVRLEDSIVFSLIERAQFPRNKSIYEPKKLIPEWDGSFMEWLLHEQECVHARVRRYQAPDELPFTSPLPAPILAPLQYPQVLPLIAVNVNDRILRFYVDELIPRICADTPDRGEKQEHYGSAATRDVECLQNLSRRIHFGRFVAEVKLRQDPRIRELIEAQDAQGLEAAITDAAVEDKVIARLQSKADTYAQGKLEAAAVADMYRQWVVPLTKLVEVEYLLRR